MDHPKYLVVPGETCVGNTGSGTPSDKRQDERGQWVIPSLIVFVLDPEFTARFAAEVAR